MVSDFLQWGAGGVTPNPSPAAGTPSSSSSYASDPQNTALEHAEDGAGTGDHTSDGMEGIQLQKAEDVDLSKPVVGLKDMTPTEDKVRVRVKARVKVKVRVRVRGPH